MESAQRALVEALLERLRTLGLISDPLYSRAVDLVEAGLELPEFFGDPAALGREEGGAGPAEST